MKDTKTYTCDGCAKQRVCDFYDQANAAKMAAVEKDIANWLVIRISARSVLVKDAIPFVEAIGHACSEGCVKKAFTNMVRKQLPE